MKKLVYGIFTFLLLTSFQQAPDIEKTLKDINDTFKNMEVKLLNWPEDLQPKLGNLKKTAFMAFPKKETKGKLPLLISLHGGGGKTWSIEEQLKRSSEVKGLSLAELTGKDLILLEPNSFEKWDPNTLNIMLDYILENYTQIDQSRIYLIGHSMGGRGIWEWIQQSPERFAAAGLGGFSGVSENDDFAKLANFPVYGMVGGEDGKNVASAKKMTDLLKAAGNKNVKYIAFPGANHPQGNKMLFSHVECVDWMLNFSNRN
ncbi:dienelactone hydrolase family protein [Hyunsoonleella sp. SJ7]|uniref:Dienelactone hydrolase family protein n=1 Tax=Hyunsoonleella aquatilis TaxID=2762758 RepID=A0A923KLD6_9FLAO|nr:dienelactone hydrolase family protein [Hyunsoonleella aquatilis]MBC3758738.1 dienelactone hydrolase family protein [Hyunsoonleella aquatilis]